MAFLNQQIIEVSHVTKKGSFFLEKKEEEKRWGVVGRNMRGNGRLPKKNGPP